MSLAFLFHCLMLYMFRVLIHPSTGACDLFVDLFHGLYCSGSMCVGVTVWFGWGGVVSLCRLKQCFSLIYLYSTIKMMHGPINIRYLMCFSSSASCAISSLNFSLFCATVYLRDVRHIGSNSLQASRETKKYFCRSQYQNNYNYKAYCIKAQCRMYVKQTPS